jgi:hypothetical protein
MWLLDKGVMRRLRGWRPLGRSSFWGEKNADIIGLSALLSTTMLEMQGVIEFLDGLVLKRKVKVV